MEVERLFARRVNHRLVFVALLGALLGLGAAFGFSMRFPAPGTGDWLGYWGVPRGVLWGRGFFDFDWLAATQQALGFPGGWTFDFSGGHYSPVVPLHNPPPIVLLLLPLAGLSFTASLLVWLGLSTVLYVRAATLFNRTLEHPLPETLALLQPFLFLPFLMAVMNGQSGPLLGGLIILAWYLQRRGHHAAAGALLVPILLKPLLLFIAQALLAWVALRRRAWGFFATFGGLSAALCLTAFLIEPGWIGGWLTKATPEGWVSHSPWDLARFWLQLPAWTPFAGPLIVGGYAAYRYRNVNTVTPRLLAEASLLSILASPFFWNHDITVLLPTAMWIASGLWARGLRAGLLAIGAVVFVVLSQQVFSVGDVARFLSVLAGTVGLWFVAGGAPSAGDEEQPLPAASSA